MMPADIAQVIANDAQEHLGGLDVISIGPIFAHEYAGDVCLQHYTVLVNREGDDFVTNIVTLAYVRDTLPAQVGRTMALETFWQRADFSDELAFAKY